MSNRLYEVFFQLLSATDNVLVFSDWHISDSDLDRRAGIIHFLIELPLISCLSVYFFC